MLMLWNTYSYCTRCTKFTSALRHYGQRQSKQNIRRSHSRLLCDASAQRKNSSAENTIINIEKVAVDLGIEEQVLNEAVRKEPGLLNIHPVLWESSLKVLRESGFSGKECINMITALPSLLKTKPEVILLGMKNWQYTVLGNNKLISLLTTCPQLLFVEGYEISRRYPVLKSLCSQKCVAELLRRYPDFMLVDWNDLMAKITYIEEEMKISRNQISKCDLLSCSLLELKTRHTFLERTGNYVAPNPKAADHVANRNPSLRQIIDNDDFHFAKLASLTLEEFEVFRELYRNELGENADDSGSD